MVVRWLAILPQRQVKIKKEKQKKIIDTNQQAVLAASSNAIVTAVNKQPNDLSKAFPESGKP